MGSEDSPMHGFQAIQLIVSNMSKLVNTESNLKTITCGVPPGSKLQINDLPRSSKKLTFRIFADDTNMFYSSKDPEQLQSVINEELGNVLKFCAANMLSINFKKTNYMLFTSPKKKTNIRVLQLVI